MNIYIWEAANLFCGDHDPTKSKHLTLEELKLPTMQGIYAEHHGGGTLMQIEVEVGVQKLEPTFKLKGFDPDVLTQFGVGTSGRLVYTAYSLIRDKRSGKALEGKSIMEGRLGKAEQDAFKRGEASSVDYAINEMMHYELWFDNREIVWWDYFTNTYRLNGVDQNGDMNRILRIPTAPTAI